MQFASRNTQHESLRPTPASRSTNQDGTRPPAGPPWSADATQLIIRTIEAYLDCTVRHDIGKTPLSHRKLLIVQFSHPGLDEVGLGRLLNEPNILSSIPVHYREKVEGLWSHSSMPNPWAYSGTILDTMHTCLMQP